MTLGLTLGLLAIPGIGFAAPPGDDAVNAPNTAATAPDEGKRAAAKAKLVEGGDLLKRGEYSDALARFKDAYELVPSPKIHYNLGLAFMGLGRNAEAMEQFELFLGDALDAAPDLRANAERHRSTLAQQTGALTVVCPTAGAEIAVDGRSFGLTPRHTPIRLDPGPHQLVVEKTGSPPFTQKLTLTPGQRLSVEAPLLDVRAAITTPPKDSAVTADHPKSETGGATDSGSDRVRPAGWLPIATWGTAGAAALFLGFGIVERLSANSKFDDFNKSAGPYGKCDADSRVRENGGGRCPGLLSDGNHAATLSAVGFVGSAALAVAAGSLYWWSGRAQSPGENRQSFLGCSPIGAPSRAPAVAVDCAFRF